jgi:hypothetical protein
MLRQESPASPISFNFNFPGSIPLATFSEIEEGTLQRRISHKTNNRWNLSGSIRAGKSDGF